MVLPAYAMFCTELAYGATDSTPKKSESEGLKQTPGTVLRATYAISGTEIAYAAVRLRHARY
eukprot:722193-Rhodomonas_salina.3